MLLVYILSFAALGAFNYFSLAGCKDEEALIPFVIWIWISSLVMMIRGTNMLRTLSLATLVLFGTIPLLSLISLAWISSFATMIRVCTEKSQDNEKPERNDEKERRDFIRRTVMTKEITEKDAAGSQDCCAICLGDYKQGETLCWSPNTRCNHAFHISCAEEWLSRQAKCPCCRSNYLLNDDADKTALAPSLMPYERKTRATGPETKKRVTRIFTNREALVHELVDSNSANYAVHSDNTKS